MELTNPLLEGTLNQGHPRTVKRIDFDEQQKILKISIDFPKGSLFFVSEMCNTVKGIRYSGEAVDASQLLSVCLLSHRKGAPDRMPGTRYPSS